MIIINNQGSYYKIKSGDNDYKIILESNSGMDEMFLNIFVLFLENDFDVSKISINKSLNGDFDSEIQVIVKNSEINEVIHSIEKLNYIEYK